MSASDGAIYVPGDVVYGDDPFKGVDAARPWMIVSNHEGQPFHGEQYVALTLTSRSWLNGLSEIPERAWLCGGTPRESRIVPWGVQSLTSDDILRWQGRLDDELVDHAIDGLVTYLTDCR